MILFDIVRKKIQDEVAKLDLSQEIDRSAKCLWTEAEDSVIISSSKGDPTRLDIELHYFISANEKAYKLDAQSCVETRAWGKIRVSAMEIYNFIKRQLEENYRDPV